MDENYDIRPKTSHNQLITNSEKPIHDVNIDCHNTANQMPKCTDTSSKEFQHSKVQLS